MGTLCLKAEQKRTETRYLLPRRKGVMIKYSGSDQAQQDILGLPGRPGGGGAIMCVKF